MGARRTWRWWGLFAFAAVALLSCGGGGPTLSGGRDTAAELAADAGDPVQAALDPPTTTTAPPPPPTTGPPTTSPPPPPPQPLAPEAAPPAGGADRSGLAPYGGLGTWLDVYDWSITYGNGPIASLDDIDRMAALGVQTLYIQASKWDSPTDVLEPDRLTAYIDRAHGDGMRVVAWYLPTLEDPALDLQRLLAIATLDVEGLAVDMESKKVADVADRNARAVQLSDGLRAALPGRVLALIPLPPVLLDEINPNYWPDYPWAALAPYYDLWMPMSYWTNRTSESGFRDAYMYTASNIDRMRAYVGNPALPCHALGGIGNGTSASDVAGMVQATVERGCIGGSVYDYRTTDDETWSALQAFRA